MKLDKDKFNKLKQLDRIEYRQKEDRIKSWQKDSWGSMFLKLIVFTLIIITLLIPQGYSVWGIEFVNDLVGIGGSIIGVLSMFMVWGFLIDFLLYIIRKKNLKELQEEYFKVEVKK